MLHVHVIITRYYIPILGLEAPAWIQYALNLSRWHLLSWLHVRVYNTHIHDRRERSVNFSRTIVNRWSLPNRSHFSNNKRIRISDSTDTCTHCSKESSIDFNYIRINTHFPCDPMGIWLHRFYLCMLYVCSYHMYEYMYLYVIILHISLFELTCFLSSKVLIVLLIINRVRL